MQLGHDTVLEAISDSSLRDFIRSMLQNEIVPTLRESAELNLSTYIEEILERFRNPEIAYRLAQIAGDGSQKNRFRLYASIEENLNAERSCSRPCFAVAAWIHAVLACHRGERPMTDPAQEQLMTIASQCSGAAERDVPLFVNAPGLFPNELRNSRRFVDNLQASYRTIAQSPHAAMASLSQLQPDPFPAVQTTARAD